MSAKSSKLNNRLKLAAIFLAPAMLLAPAALQAAPQEPKDLDQQIFDVMVQLPGSNPAYRAAHAKGLVCQGTFAASPEAAKLSRAAHFQAASVPVTIRFSDGAADPAIPDPSPNAYPRGIAIRFTLPDGSHTDIVSISHNGFIVGTGEDFLALQKSVIATDPTKPHPWPVEAFIGSHPRALKFVQDANPLPASFANLAFYSNNAFIFINKAGAKQAIRYQVLPVAGPQPLSDAEAKSKGPNYLFDELKSRLAKAPVKYRLVAQLPQPGDPTNDGSIVWPADRKTVELGVITITSVDPDSAASEKALAFDPIRLTDGIDLSDDPLPTLRSNVYTLSVARRRKNQ